MLLVFNNTKIEFLFLSQNLSLSGWLIGQSTMSTIKWRLGEMFVLSKGLNIDKGNGGKWTSRNGFMSDEMKGGLGRREWIEIQIFSCQLVVYNFYRKINSCEKFWSKFLATFAARYRVKFPNYLEKAFHLLRGNT